MEETIANAYPCYVNIKKSSLQFYSTFFYEQFYFSSQGYILETKMKQSPDSNTWKQM